MKLDDLLKHHAAWFDEMLKRPMLDKVDAKAVEFSQEQRQRRIAELQHRIDDLSRRRDEMVASYDRAIEQEKVELERLQTPPQTPPPSSPAGDRKPSRAARSKRS